MSPFFRFLLELGFHFYGEEVAAGIVVVDIFDDGLPVGMPVVHIRGHIFVEVIARNDVQNRPEVFHSPAGTPDVPENVSLILGWAGAHVPEIVPFMKIERMQIHAKCDRVARL